MSLTFYVVINKFKQIVKVGSIGKD